ncbi:hypothetical protein TBLA_0E00420 [Henningerozyma blattae CBS 6284]|uniref:Uncharacterized protein n=1 Tax=Henningerozyma blattae (strain ATCC 34711 / CBS 6284 / DSM 70876 / NBRC 10599 / NRRL Y-10934 / UCD 77-7) TaxID=1071380 RepID=I2H401_HENB6|nr:hypothetical protein TBLA_0E00420 [Tetrapisispora blattae CBS 6284]CCH61103.1 hypothetical protein TBLA_0E00420 [Tetrapisispora blattae CBS 6284]
MIEIIEIDSGDGSDMEIIRDSQTDDNDDDSLIILNDFKENPYESLLDSTDDEHDNNQFLDESLAGDAIFSLITQHKQSTNLDLDKNGGNNIKNEPSIKDSKVEIKQSDLGDDFDEELGKKMKRFRDISDDITTLKKRALDYEYRTDSNNIALLKKQIKYKEISNNYLEMVANETLSGKYKDWFFFTENSRFNEDILEDIENFSSKEIMLKYGDFKKLLVCFGTNIKYLYQDYNISDLKYKYDTLSILQPIDTMKVIIGHYFIIDPINFKKFFPSLLLDRNFYESLSIDDDWCTSFYNKITPKIFFKNYFKVVNKTDFFLHYRLIRIIPSSKNLIISLIFSTSVEVKDVEKNPVIEMFNYLIDEKNYKNLLYFILVLSGSNLVPFGSNKYVDYFQSCINDISDENSNEVELTLVRNILKLFEKVLS